MLRPQPVKNGLGISLGFRRAYVMLAAQVSKKLRGGTSVAGFHIVITATNSLDGLGKILAFPFQIGCESVI